MHAFNFRNIHFNNKNYINMAFSPLNEPTKYAKYAERFEQTFDFHAKKPAATYIFKTDPSIL